MKDCDTREAKAWKCKSENDKIFLMNKYRGTAINCLTKYNYIYFYNYEIGDIQAEANLLLLLAIDSYDPSKSAFKTYLINRCNYKAKEELRIAFTKKGQDLWKYQILKFS